MAVGATAIEVMAPQLRYLYLILPTDSQPTLIKEK
jgi:hypothetical protein